MSQKLYVGNLSYSVTETQLHDLFAEVGEVASASVVTDRETGRSRGFGFVEMTMKTDAEEAIRRLNGKMLGDREIQVSEARPSRSSGGGGGRRDRNDRRGGGGGGGRRY
jgi:RNA recognition motif-containing protein